MKLAEYARHDALGLAELVARKQISPKELAVTAAKAIAAVNADVKAVIETYPDRIESLDEKSLGNGPFHGVPFLMKDVFSHEKGRKVEFASRLCAGMTADVDSYMTTQLRTAGVNILGRSAAPEYSMSATTESLMFGNTSTPWKKGYSAGGSSGGAAAAVASGMVPIAHGSDIGGSIRIPASWCGGVGLKPSRMRVSVGPTVDEGGFGYSANLIQSRTVRDTATMLDCLSHPQIGDPFVIPKPAESYAKLHTQKPGKLRIAMILSPLFGVAVDPEVAAAVKATAKALESAGHSVDEITVDVGGISTMQTINELFFFGFADRLDGYAKRTGRKPSAETLEPCMLAIYEWSRSLTANDFMTAWGTANAVRRKLAAQVFTKHDIWLSPTTARVSEPWGKYNLARTGLDPAGNFIEEMFAPPCQFTIPHNLMGTPAMSLPLALHSNGLPIGVQIAAKPAEEHVVLQLAAHLEQAMPWKDRLPALHVSNFDK
jgi:amidase